MVSTAAPLPSPSLVPSPATRPRAGFTAWPVAVSPQESSLLTALSQGWAHGREQVSADWRVSPSRIKTKKGHLLWEAFSDPHPSWALAHGAAVSWRVKTAEVWTAALQLRSPQRPLGWPGLTSQGGKFRLQRGVLLAQNCRAPKRSAPKRALSQDVLLREARRLACGCGQLGCPLSGRPSTVGRSSGGHPELLAPTPAKSPSGCLSLGQGGTPGPCPCQSGQGRAELWERGPSPGREPPHGQVGARHTWAPLC